jgi:hypothetical protein
VRRRNQGINKDQHASARMWEVLRTLGRPHGKLCPWRPPKRYQSIQTLWTRKRYQETLRLVVSSLYVLTTHCVGLETSPAEGRFSPSWSRNASAKLLQLTIEVIVSCRVYAKHWRHPEETGTAKGKVGWNIAKKNPFNERPNLTISYDPYTDCV